jgi:hypothetical protein
MSFLDKFRDAAQKAGIQANAFAQQTGRAINEQAATARAGFPRRPQPPGLGAQLDPQGRSAASQGPGCL